MGAVNHAPSSETMVDAKTFDPSRGAIGWQYLLLFMSWRVLCSELKHIPFFEFRMEERSESWCFGLQVLPATPLRHLVIVFVLVLNGPTGFHVFLLDGRHA